MPKNKNGLRKLLIAGMKREQLINFIKRKDEFYCAECIENLSDKNIRQIALFIDEKFQEKKQKLHIE